MYTYKMIITWMLLNDYFDELFLWQTPCLTSRDPYKRPQ